MTLVGVLFGDDSGRCYAGGSDAVYWLCDIARMAGVPENRALEYAERLERLGVIERIEEPSRATYRFVVERGDRAWRSAESERLRCGVRGILSDLQRDLASGRSFVEGTDYVLLGGSPSSSFDAHRPHVVLGAVLPRSLLSVLAEFDEAFHKTWIKLLLSGWAMGASQEEELRELRETLSQMVDRVASAYSKLTAEDLRQMSEYLNSHGDSHGPKTVVLYSLP